MEDTEKVSGGVESAAMMLEQLEKAFADLESHKESSTQNNIGWDDIKEHFQILEKSLKDILDEVKMKEKTLEEKQSEARALIAEKEAAVSAKEHASLARLQELRDSAVSAIAEARQKYKVASPEPIDIKGSKEKKVSTLLNETNAPNPASEEKNPDNASGEVRPQLKQLCEQMDAKGLLKFILEKKRNLGILRDELSVALKHAAEPARLVLESLEGFFPLDQSNPPGNEDNTLQGLRRSCLVLMESAAPLLGLTEPGVNYPLSSEIKQHAKEIADKWRPKLAGLNLDASNGYSLEAQAFLQLLATFSIAPEIDEDELCKLVIAVSRRRQAPEFCRSLGLTQKVPGLIEDLVSKGRQIDAVHFAHAFWLTDRFPLVPLLKAYLSDLKDAEETTGDTGVAVVQDPAAKELGALRAVIKCIEEYKLQEEYPLDPLQRRIGELEKAKADKKRIVESAKFQSKRPRASKSYIAPRRHAAAVDNWQHPPAAYDHRASQPGGPERYPYNLPPAYEAPVHAAYGQQTYAQRAYHYPDERIPYAAYGASSNYGSYTSTTMHPASNNYAHYMGAGQPPASSTYGSYTGTSFQPPHQSYM